MRLLSVVLIASLGGQLRPPTITPIWTTLPSAVRRIGLSPDGHCIAAIAGSKAYVLDDSGKQLWDADLLESIPQMNFEIAVAPSCDWVGAWVWSSTSVQLLRRDSPANSVQLVDPASQRPGFGLHLRSMQISPNGELLAIGTERGRIVLVTRAGAIKKDLSAEGFDDMPVQIEFAGNDRLLITGWWNTGLMTVEGKWLWHQGIDFARVQPSRDLSIYAGWFAPTHGPQGGIVGLLDSRGGRIWTREVWDPATAIAPDGSFMAFSITETTDGGMPGDPPGNARPEVWLVDRSGRELTHRRVEGRVEGISSRGTCIFLGQRSKPDTPFDLVALDKKLNEVWRIPAAFTSNHVFFPGGDLLLQESRSEVRTFHLPDCTSSR